MHNRERGKEVVKEKLHRSSLAQRAPAEGAEARCDDEQEQHPLDMALLKIAGLGLSQTSVRPSRRYATTPNLAPLAALIAD